MRPTRMRSESYPDGGFVSRGGGRVARMNALSHHSTVNLG